MKPLLWRPSSKLLLGREVLPTKLLHTIIIGSWRCSHLKVFCYAFYSQITFKSVRAVTITSNPSLDLIILHSNQTWWSYLMSSSYLRSLSYMMLSSYFHILGALSVLRWCSSTVLTLSWYPPDSVLNFCGQRTRRDETRRDETRQRDGNSDNKANSVQLSWD